MNMSPVSRLKKTWGKAKTAKFFILEVNTARPFIHWLTVTWGVMGSVHSMLPVAVCSDSIRWIPPGIFTTTERPWGGPPIALGLPTATEKGWGGSAPHPRYSPENMLARTQPFLVLLTSTLPVSSCLFFSLRLWFPSSVCWLKTFTSWTRDVPIGCPMAMSTLRWDTGCPFSFASCPGLV